MEEKFIYKEEYKYLSNAVFNVTNDCNLKCKYCFVEQHPQYMTLEIAKMAVDYLYKNLQKKKEMGIIPPKGHSRIQFFGGEPTLCYDTIIVPVVEYCKEKYPNSFTFGISTNGTLLNKEKIDFFKKNNFNLLLSIDGAKKTQDFNRPCKNCNLSSFDLLEKNIPYLLEQFPDVCFRSTIYGPTAHHLFENYLYAEQLGFKSWEGIEDMRHPWTEKQIEILKQEISKIYLHRLQQIAKGIVPMSNCRFEWWEKQLSDLILDNKKINISISQNVKRCGLGTNSGSIGYDGSIYGCQEQTSKNDSNHLFYIGNLFTGGIDTQLHTKLLEFYYNSQKPILKKEECATCPVSQICKLNFLLCPSCTYDIFEDMTSMTKVSCELSKAYFYNTYLLLYSLVETNKKEEF